MSLQVENFKFTTTTTKSDKNTDKYTNSVRTSNTSITRASVIALDL